MQSKNNNNNTTSSMPQDVYEHMLQFLPVRDVISTTCINQNAYHTIHQSPSLWKQLFMRDFPCSILSPTYLNYKQLCVEQQYPCLEWMVLASRAVMIAGCACIVLSLIICLIVMTLFDFSRVISVLMGMFVIGYLVDIVCCIDGSKNHHTGTTKRVPFRSWCKSILVCGIVGGLLFIQRRCM
jgi:hypothetical protein